MIRHKEALAERLSQNIKLSRASIGPVMVKEYFKNLQNQLKDVPPGNLVNFGETNLVDDQGREKIIVKHGCRYPERVCNSTKSATSLMCAAAADCLVTSCIRR